MNKNRYGLNEFGTRHSGENPFVGTPYEDMWNNNPYASMYYEPTFWDSIGLSNKAKDTNAEYERLYNEYVAGIYDQQRKDNYNSPSEEVERMRLAGLNPDLQGLSGNGTDAMTAPNAGPNPSLNGQSPAVSSLDMIGRVLSFATSGLQSIATIKNLSSQTSGQNIRNFDSFVEIIKPHIVNEYSKRFSGKSPRSWEDVKSDAVEYFTGTSERKLASRAFDSILRSSDFTASEKAYSNINANDKAMRDFIGKMVEYEYLAKVNSFKAQNAKNNYDASYYNSLDPGTSAAAVNRENSTRGWLDKWRKEFYQRMYSDFKNGSDLAGLILIGSADIPGIVGVSALNSRKGTWLDSGIQWNDSVVSGLAKRFNLF